MEETVCEGALEMTIGHLSGHGEDKKRVLCHIMQECYCDAWID